MFGKLLKYDFTHYLKLWIIGAVTVIAMSFVGGFCLSQLGWLYRTNNTFIALIFTLAVIITVVSFIAFSILTTVLICMRYAKNCFSDQGYLTFTLPAKKSTIFNAKFINGIIYYIMCVAIEIICFLIFLGIGIKNFMYELSDFIYFFLYIFSPFNLGIYFWFYLIIGIVLLILSCLFSVSMIYFCITFAGTKVRKNKVLAGIGIYYLFSIILGIVSQLASYLLIFVLQGRDYNLNNEAVIVLLLLLAVWLFGAVSALYFSQLHMLDKKLDLA